MRLVNFGKRLMHSYMGKSFLISLAGLILLIVAGAMVMAPGTTRQENKSVYKTTEQDPATSSVVQWYSFEEAVLQSEKTKKKIFIDVYTDWCGWCKVMDRNTFSDPEVAKLLNEEFYAVKFNAEQREDVVFRGHTFKFIQSGRGGYHQLAASLLNNQLSYPTVVFLDEEFNMIMPLPGFRKPEEFHKFLTYVSDGHYKKGQAGWNEFEKAYKPPYQAN